ncbi:MAG: YCF48-related protein [Candidatus Acidiferrum sp.]
MAKKLRGRTHSHFGIFRLLLVVLAVFFNGTVSSASEWRTVELPARALNIVENNGTLWVCGADELIAASADGANTWTTKHVTRNGSLLLTVGFSGEEFGYAAGTGGQMLITKDGGGTWNSIAVPSEVVYEASFSDENHGIIHAQRGIYETNDGGTTWVPVPIDFSGEDLKGFSNVLSVVALDVKHLAIVLGEGNSSAYDYRLLLTADDGAKWTVSMIPSTGLGKLSAHDGEYWFAGMEVIEKDKPGGGYGVPLVMHSADGEKWTHLPRWSKNEFSECSMQGCLYWDGAGVQLPPTDPVGFWTFAPEKAVTAKWAVAKRTICAVGTGLECSAVTTTQAMPPYSKSSSPITPPAAAPPLDVPPAQGLQCISCDFERIMVTPDFQGVAEVQLKLHVGVNGLVEQAEIAHATNAGVGERIAASARNWIFVPFVKDGVVHPANTEVKLRVQAVKSK